MPCTKEHDKYLKSKSSTLYQSLFRSTYEGDENFVACSSQKMTVHLPQITLVELHKAGQILQNMEK